MKGVCPKCQHHIEIGENPEIGSSVVCPSCHTSLEIIWLFPLSLEAKAAEEHTLILLNPKQANAFAEET